MIRLLSTLNRLTVLAAVAFLIPVIAVFSAKAMVPLLIVLGLVLVWNTGWSALNSSLLPRGPAIALGLLLIWAATSALWSSAPMVVLTSVWPLALLITTGLASLGLAGRLPMAPRRSLQTGLAAGLFVAVCLIVFEAATLSWMTRQIKGLEWTDLIDHIAGGRNLDAFFKDSIAILSLLIWPLSAFLLRRRKAIWIVVMVVILGGAAIHFGATTAVIALAGGVLLTVSGYISVTWTARAAATGFLIAVIAMPFILRPVISESYLTATAENRESQTLPLPMSAINRLHTWKFAVSKIEEKAVTGWGLKASRYLPGANEKYNVYVTNKQGTRVIAFRDFYIPLHTHNQALQIWLELGSIGVLIIATGGFWLIWSLGGRPRRDGPDEQPLAFGLVAAILAYDLLSFGAWQNWWIATQFISVLLLVAASGPADADPDALPP